MRWSLEGRRSNLKISEGVGAVISIYYKLLLCLCYTHGCSTVIKVIIDAGLARYRRCFTHSPNPQNGLSGGGISRIQKKKVIDVVSLILLSKRIITVLGGVSPFSYADVLIF